MREARTRSIVCTLGLLPLWASLLPAYLVFDPMARAAILPGALAASALAVSAVFLTDLLRRHGLLSRPRASTAALDVVLSTTASATLLYIFLDQDGRVSSLGGTALLAMNVATGWGAGLVVYLWSRRATSIRDDGAPPGIVGLCAVASVWFSVVAAIVLGIGSEARNSGAHEAQSAADVSALADLAAVSLVSLTGDGLLTAPRTQSVKDVLQTFGNVEVEVTPLGALPARFSGPETRWHEHEPGAFTVCLLQTRAHVERRELGDKLLWVLRNAALPAPVVPREDRPALLIFAAFFLIAPLAAALVARGLRDRLNTLSRVLSSLGPGGSFVAAPHGPADELGDLAAEIDEAVFAAASGNTRLTFALEGAQAADRARDRFLSSASHELRTPLTSISGYCHLLRSGELTEAQSEDVLFIEQATEQLKGHIDVIIDLTRIESGLEAPLSRTWVVCEDLVRQVLAARRQDVPAGVKVSLDAPSGQTRALVDAARILQVLDNLIGNALKFTPQGFVKVSVGADEEGVSMRVADSGPGIASHELTAIFVDFHRVEGQRDVPGTGLGLAIARRLVTQHGGRIWAESQLGVGSTFHVVVPTEKVPTP